MTKPKITIIMPNFNGEKYIEKSIMSFLEQDYENKELLVVDGKSTDSSHEIIKKFSKSNENIRWIKELDKGISDAINIALNYCKGEIIGYLGSDDLLYKDIFKEIEYHSRVISFDAIYFNSYTYYINEKKCIYRTCPKIEFTRSNLIEYGNIVGLQNIYFKKHIFNNNYYNIQNRYSMDYEFYLQIVKNNLQFLFVDKVATINIFDGNITGCLSFKQKKETLMVAFNYCKSIKDYYICLKKYLFYWLTVALK